MPRLGIVLQARLGSSRLPGKVLRPLAGTPMLDRVLVRLRQIRGAGVVVVATTAEERDDPVAEHASAAGIEIFRGSEHDVLDRYYRCALAFDLDPIVRATADNPFVDPEEGDRLVDYFTAGDFDYAAASSDLGNGLPIGTGLEVMSRAALEQSWRYGTAPHHREHVNEYILENRHLFRCGAPPVPPSKLAPHVRLTVDTEAEFFAAEALIAAHDQETGGREEISTAWLIAATSRAK